MLCVHDTMSYTKCACIPYVQEVNVVVVCVGTGDCSLSSTVQGYQMDPSFLHKKGTHHVNYWP